MLPVAASAAAPVAARQRILDAALVLFASHGFEGASTREMALAAGVQQGLVGYHFRSKDALWRAVVDAGFARLGAAALARGPLRAVEPRQRLRLQLERVLELAAAEPLLMRLLCHAALHADPRLGWLIERHLQPLHAALQSALACLPQARGSLPALDRQLLGWLAAQVAFQPLFAGADAVPPALATCLQQACLDAWLGEGQGVGGAWSPAAARLRALQRAEGAP
jgi:AcrR family transcriptional regulator